MRLESGDLLEKAFTKMGPDLKVAKVSDAILRIRKVSEPQPKLYSVSVSLNFNLSPLQKARPELSTLSKTVGIKYE